MDDSRYLSHPSETPKNNVSWNRQTKRWDAWCRLVALCEISINVTAAYDPEVQSLHVFVAFDRWKQSKKGALQYGFSGHCESTPQLPWGAEQKGPHCSIGRNHLPSERSWGCESMISQWLKPPTRNHRRPGLLLHRSLNGFQGSAWIWPRHEIWRRPCHPWAIPNMDRYG